MPVCPPPLLLCDVAVSVSQDQRLPPMRECTVKISPPHPHLHGCVPVLFSTYYVLHCSSRAAHLSNVSALSPSVVQQEVDRTRPDQTSASSQAPAPEARPVAAAANPSPTPTLPASASLPSVARPSLATPQAAFTLLAAHHSCLCLSINVAQASSFWPHQLNPL